MNTQDIKNNKDIKLFLGLTALTILTIAATPLAPLLLVVVIFTPLGPFSKANGNGGFRILILNILFIACGIAWAGSIAYDMQRVQILLMIEIGVALAYATGCFIAKDQEAVAELMLALGVGLPGVVIGLIILFTNLIF